MATPIKRTRSCASAPPTPGSAGKGEPGTGPVDARAVVDGLAAPTATATTATAPVAPPSRPSAHDAHTVGHDLEEERVKQLYLVMGSVENRLGGGEGVEGLYGSLTRTGMDRVLKALASHAGGLGAGDHLLDVGAGLGRPLLHALALGAGAASGVEVDAVKVEKAVAFAEQTARGLVGRAGGAWLAMESTSTTTAATATTATAPAAAGPPAPPRALAALPDVQCAPIEAMPSLDPATHVFSFWEGIPPAARAAFGRLVRASSTIRGVAVVQRAARGAGPAAMMAAAGFGDLRLRAAFPVSMSGSGRSFQAYVFVRDVPDGAAAPADCTAPLPRAVVVGDDAQSEAPPAAASRAGSVAAPAPSSAPPTPSSSARSARRDRRRAGLPAPGRPPLAQRPITEFGRVVRFVDAQPAGQASCTRKPGAIARPGKVTPHPCAVDAVAAAAARAAAPGSPAAVGGKVGGSGRARRALAPASPGVAKAGPRKAVPSGRPPLAPRGLGGALAAAT